MTEQLLVSPVDVYIGLGSNLDNPRQQIKQALQELTELPHCQLTAQSQLYRSDPVGPADQPDYINAVARIECQLQPESLLDQLQALEQSHRRVRKQHWGPRTLDLDILLFGNEQINSDRLSVPHSHMAERSFVLYPLAEISPELQFPDGRKLSQLLTQCPIGTLEPISD